MGQQQVGHGQTAAETEAEVVACLGNPDPVGMEAYAASGREICTTFFRWRKHRPEQFDAKLHDADTMLSDENQPEKVAKAF